MANIVIRKKITLEFLGDEYKDGFLVFKGVSIDEFTEIEKKAEAKGDDLNFIKTFLRDRFLEGKFPNVEKDNELQDVTKEDLGKLDPETIIVIFQVLGGGIAANPKEPNN